MRQQPRRTEPRQEASKPKDTVRREQEKTERKAVEPAARARPHTQQSARSTAAQRSKSRLGEQIGGLSPRPEGSSCFSAFDH